MRDRGGVQKYIEVIRWAAFTFPEMAASLYPATHLDTQPDEATLNTSEIVVDQQGGRESRSRRSIKATPSGFLSIMLNVNDLSVVESSDKISGPVQAGERQDLSVEGDNLQGWNWRVANLCRILCSFLVPAGDVPSIAGGLQGGQEAIRASGLYWELATRCIVNVLLGVFRGGDDMGHGNKALQASR